MCVFEIQCFVIDLSVWDYPHFLKFIYVGQLNVMLFILTSRMSMASP